jgi:peptidoglycan-associated lipoprotein
MRHGLVSVMMVAVAIAVFGCAKRPVTIMASAPPPTGATAASPTSNTSSAGPAARPEGPTSATRGGEPGSVGSRPAPREFAAAAELKDIHFDFDKYAIRPDDAQILERDAAWLKANPTGLLLIEGHCDERGTNEYNLALGDRRARATMNFLVSRESPPAESR